jgi:transposase
MAKTIRINYRRYTDKFKATAVRMSKIPGVMSKDVAEALDIHPLMLSRWRKDYREGKIDASKGKEIKLQGREVTELKRLRKLEQAHQLLKEEHALLKKAIQFSLEKRKTYLSL